MHAELLTWTTSCQIHNLSEEALTREASKVLKRRAGGKLASGASGKGKSKQKWWKEGQREIKGGGGGLGR